MTEVCAIRILMYMFHFDMVYMDFSILDNVSLGEFLCMPGIRVTEILLQIFEAQYSSQTLLRSALVFQFCCSESKVTDFFKSFEFGKYICFPVQLKIGILFLRESEDGESKTPIKSWVRI